MQTPALTWPPAISLLPAGQELINGPVAAASTIPSVMLADSDSDSDSDGSDSANPLLIPSTANAMVNWFAQTAIDDLAGSKDPQCNEDETHAFLQGIVEWTAELLVTSFGMSGIDAGVSPAQWNATKGGFPTPPMQRGHVVHDSTAVLLRLLFPGQWKYRAAEETMRDLTSSTKRPDTTSN